MKNFPLSIEAWTARAENHRALIEPMTEAFLKRRELKQTHAVHDFLFTYYSCSPQKLKQWVPSFEEELIVDPTLEKNYPWLNAHWFQLKRDTLSLNQEHLQENVRGLAQFISTLCSNILKRSSRFGCFGLHEWAMVYKSSHDGVRHKNHPLRLSEENLARFVESQTLCCTHYDAYRFFTKEAKPLNTLSLSLETRLELEQGGCVHANMDLYKWAIKLWPWIGSDFIAKAFFLALEGRELDMRASPYDLKEYGYVPICIETETGRLQYQKEQQRYAEKTTSLRQELQILSSRLSLLNPINSLQK